MLRKLGLSPQRRAFKQDELLVVEWMAKDFHAIQKIVREQNAEIFSLAMSPRSVPTITPARLGHHEKKLLL